jgi:cell division protein YceG involved in septum cleavage
MKKILKFILLFIIISLAYIYYLYSNIKSDILITETTVIEIKSGETIKDLAEKLDINYYLLRKYLKNKDFKLLK